jgi:hypothetical protein
MEGVQASREALRQTARWRRLKSSGGPRRTPRRRRLQRGQGLIIFAISLTVLMGMVGLAVDALRAYDLYAREHRAAEAAALAGVLYMPNFYNTSYTTTSGASTSTDSAISRALRLAYADGFGDGVTAPSSCTAPNTSMQVTVCKADPSLGLKSTTALQVTITEPISVFFLSLVGIQSFPVSATSVSDFLPGLNLGSNDPNDTRSYYWSDGGECNDDPTPPPSCSAGLHDFAAAINGPAELKQQGDPFVNCEEGPSVGPLNNPPGVNGVDPTANQSPEPFKNAVTGLYTNHPQYPSTYNCGTGNPDQQPGGFTGPQTAGTSHPGAYNFFVQGPPAPPISGLTGYSLWVFNPSFDPAEPSSCNGTQLPDQFFQDLSCSTYYNQYSSQGYVASGGSATGVPRSSSTDWTDPRLYFNVTYTLYKVTVLYDRNGDQEQVGDPTQAEISSYPQQPYSSMGSFGCGQGAFQLKTTSAGTGACITKDAANKYDWVKIKDNLGWDSSDQNGLWRLAVESTDYNPWGDPSCGQFNCGWGVHSFGIKLCPAKWPDPKSVDSCWPSLPPTGTSVRPWNNMDVLLLFNNASLTNQVPLADLPASFAGRTITISVFNPGPSHGHNGNAYFMIVPPAFDDSTPTPNPNPQILVKATWPPPSDGTPGIYYPPWEQSRLVNFPGSVTSGNNLSLQATAGSGGGAPSDNIYQGLWTTATVVLPSGYLGGQWWIDVFNDKGKDFNEFTVSFSLNGGSPVHIIF